jgi:hypothetical protein
MTPEAKLSTDAFFIQQPVISIILKKKNIVREQKYGKIIYYAQLVYHLLSSNFLVTSHDDLTRSRFNDKKYLGITNK